jgi:hypothetical protein
VFAQIHDTCFVAGRGAMARLLLWELVGAEQNYRVRSPRRSSQLGFRGRETLASLPRSGVLSARGGLLPFVGCSLLTRHCGRVCAARRKAARGRASARARSAAACAASASLFSLRGAKTRFCALAGSFELAHTCWADGPLSVGLGLVQLVALAGILSLCSQVVQMPGEHELEDRGGGGGRSVAAMRVSDGRVGGRSRCRAACS